MAAMAARKKERVQKAEEVMDRIQSIVGRDRGWATEEEMLEEIAFARRGEVDADVVQV